jgi:hypothetical protein
MSKSIAFALSLALLCAPTLAAADACPVLPDAQRICQDTVSKAGSVYAKLALKAVQSCLNKIQKGDLSGDPLTVCRGSLAIPPTDATTADKLTAAADKVLTILQAKCLDADVLALDLCDPTVAGLATLASSPITRRVSTRPSAPNTAPLPRVATPVSSSARRRWPSRAEST